MAPDGASLSSIEAIAANPAAAAAAAQPRSTAKRGRRDRDARLEDGAPTASSPKSHEPKRQRADPGPSVQLPPARQQFGGFQSPPKPAANAPSLPPPVELSLVGVQQPPLTTKPCQPLLVGLPNQGSLLLAGKEAACRTAVRLNRLARAADAQAHRPQPRITDAQYLERLRGGRLAGLPVHVVASAQDHLLLDSRGGSQSRLDVIVKSFLRQQHRQACMQARHPLSVVPPMSLVRPHQIPDASRWLDAPCNIGARLARRETLDPFGGTGGRALFRRYHYSRFRTRLTCREGTSLVTCATFMPSLSALITGNAIGVRSGGGDVPCAFHELVAGINQGQPADPDASVPR